MQVAHFVCMCRKNKWIAYYRNCVAQKSRLKQPEKAVVEELRNGDRTKGSLVDFTGYHRNTIYRALERLEALGVVNCIHQPTALYSLENDPS